MRGSILGMMRTDYRFNRSERSLDPPDDDEPDEGYEAQELRRELAIEARMDEMRDRALREEGR